MIPDPISGTVFDEAVVGFISKLRSFVRRRVADDATADDLTQETLFRIYRARNTAKLPDTQRLEAWIYRIARNTLISYYRKQRPVSELPELLVAEPLEKEDEFRLAVLAAMRRFLGELPIIYREPVRLAELEGLPLAKIALRLNLSLSAVKARVRRGRVMLRKKLQACCRFEFDRMGKVIDWERRKPCGC
ncbi:MAG: sigma-70 family RNA polymerase sigma factor [Cephaloticoccus sp.]|nr:sigma-70 family RNA polymerase sigma factor [Cephaloticoccus sp.]MCF7758908.1 sigma-70 family RNA polymerase sigma factor [Cephaloticoccus sp.]